MQHIIKSAEVANINKGAILIPARYSSERLPGKPCFPLDGVPMIKRVVTACKHSDLPVFVLTDSKKVANAVNKNTTVIIDEQTKFRNGTERCASILDNDIFNKYDYFINVQGDMPDVTVEMIHSCRDMLHQWDVSTAYTDLKDFSKERTDPSTVKLVRSNGDMLWCGRGFTGYGDWHLGIYGYRRSALEKYTNLTVYTEEIVESLEQLRWIKNGYSVGCTEVEFDGVEINNIEDVNKWEARHAALSDKDIDEIDSESRAVFMEFESDWARHYDNPKYK